MYALEIEIYGDLQFALYPHVERSITFYDTGYIGVRVPLAVYTYGVYVTLPYEWQHWTHEVSHKRVTRYHYVLCSWNVNT